MVIQKIKEKAFRVKSHKAVLLVISWLIHSLYFDWAVMGIQLKGFLVGEIPTKGTRCHERNSWIQKMKIFSSCLLSLLKNMSRIH